MLSYSLINRRLLAFLRDPMLTTGTKLGLLSVPRCPFCDREIVATRDNSMAANASCSQCNFRVSILRGQDETPHTYPITALRRGDIIFMPGDCEPEDRDKRICSIAEMTKWGREGKGGRRKKSGSEGPVK